MMICLVVASPSDLHADAVVDRLHDRCCVIRVDPFSYDQAISFCDQTQMCSIERHVFHFSEIVGVYCRVAIEALNYEFIDDIVERYSAGEWLCALVGILLLVPRSRWINHPWTESMFDGKVNPLILASRSGMQVPRFIVSSRTEQLKNFVESVGSCIIKPLSDKSIAFQDGKFVEVPLLHDFMAPYSVDFDLEKCGSLVTDETTPTLIQKKISKSGDLRVVVVDDHVFGTFLPLGSSIVDSRMANRDGECVAELGEVFCSLVRKFVREKLHLRFCMLDFVVSIDSVKYLVDVNPSGNWLWQENGLLIPISSAIANALTGPFDAAITS